MSIYTKKTIRYHMKMAVEPLTPKKRILLRYNTDTPVANINTLINTNKS